MSKRLKRIPRFHDEAEEREFWATHDSTEFVDWIKRARYLNHVWSYDFVFDQT